MKQYRNALLYCDLDDIKALILPMAGGSASYALRLRTIIQQALEQWDNVILTGDIDSDSKTVIQFALGMPNVNATRVFSYLHPHIHRVVFPKDHHPMDYIIDRINIRTITDRDLVLDVFLLKIVG